MAARSVTNRREEQRNAMAAVDKLTRQMLAGEQMSSVAALARDAPEWARAFVDAAERRVRELDDALASARGDVVKLRELLDAGAEVCRGDYVSGCVESISGRPTPSTRRRPRSSICAMAWRFQAIDATLSP